jgi:transglutaminase-like putative cysteine protease/predicted transcriptional regulator
MNPRLTLTSAVAVILASVSLYPLIQTASWFWAGMGAVIAAAIAGTISRLPTLQAAVGTSVLALIAVAPLLANPSWGLKALGVVIVAVTAGSRPRFRVLQVLACPIAYLSALLIYLNAVFAARLSMAGIVPTRASISYLSTLVSSGMQERYLEPPVPGNPGIILVAAAGIGLMAAATDLIAVRLRSPAIAGLPLLALYCVRITTSAKQGGTGATVVFCLGMIGYLALLAADGRERLRIWGRLVTVWHSSAADPAEAAEAPDTRALAASGRRIGLAAACLALIAPLLVPGINVHDLLRSQTGGGVGQGGTLIATPDPMVEMRQQLLSTSARPVLTYTTNAPNPQYQYLQVYVLNYDQSNQEWTLVLPQPQGSASLNGNALRPAPGVTADTSVTRPTTKITLSQGAVGYEARLGALPLPYAPARVQIPEGGWQEDDATQMVYSTQPQMSGLPYTVTSTEVKPTPRQENLAPSYPASISGNYLSFPAGPGRELAALAARITKGARTPYQKAWKLQSYFHSGAFSYDLNVSLPDGIPGLVDFLYTVRAGYCQQFAFAMAALARLVGIPSRIAVGYTAGTSNGKGTWTVTTADAHAWPELYFKGMGWLRFEPTPGGAAGQGTATVPQYAGGAPPGYGKEPTTTPYGAGPGGRIAKGGIPDLAHLRRPGIGGGGGPALSVGHGRSIVPWILLAVAIALGLGLITPPIARRLIRSHRLRTADDAGLAHATWRELHDDLADYGLGCRASESPRAVASRIVTTLRLDPATAEALDRIARAEERARYATAPLPGATLAADSAAVRRALAKQADWIRRWRARLMPTSTLTPIRVGLQHALDVFGWMDAAGLKFRGRAFGGPSAVQPE